MRGDRKSGGVRAQPGIACFAVLIYCMFRRVDLTPIYFYAPDISQIIYFAVPHLPYLKGKG